MYISTCQHSPSSNTSVSARTRVTLRAMTTTTSICGQGAVVGLLDTCLLTSAPPARSRHLGIPSSSSGAHLGSTCVIWPTYAVGVRGITVVPTTGTCARHHQFCTESSSRRLYLQENRMYSTGGAVQQSQKSPSRVVDHAWVPALAISHLINGMYRS